MLGRFDERERDWERPELEGLRDRTVGNGMMHMRRRADRLFGSQYHWRLLGARGNQYAIAAQAASRDGNIRVGLKDSLWIWSDAL